MRQKAYYKDLAEKYFDAATTLAEERELREFLAVTTDSDFDDVKTVMGFMLVAAEAYDCHRRQEKDMVCGCGCCHCGSHCHSAFPRQEHRRLHNDCRQPHHHKP